MIEIYTPKHGKWERDDLFRVAKLMDITAKKIGIEPSLLLDNLDGGALFNLLDTLSRMESAFLEMTEDNWKEIRKNTLSMLDAHLTKALRDD